MLWQALGSNSAEVESPPADNATSTAASTGVSSPAAAHKHAASEAYELEDLDEDWLALLNALDTRLMEVCLWCSSVNVANFTMLTFSEVIFIILMPFWCHTEELVDPLGGIDCLLKEVCLCCDMCFHYLW